MLLDDENPVLDGYDCTVHPLFKMAAVEGSWAEGLWREMVDATEMIGAIANAMAEYHSWAMVWGGRRLGMTEKGYVCSLDPRTLVGDFLGGLDGVSHDFILRKTRKDEYKIVGTAHIHGLESVPQDPQPIQVV